ncbi:hypothetical protein [Moraxella oblonga]|uniref:hypothetical protein n=1 Tax=Moraxella oblonga TaxID=200413 RepID=UPI00082A1544|nr:hypothetical protein [Moraxella oblonga]
MTTYRLKISLAKPFLPITELHRLIDVDVAMSFGELATHIGAVFGTKMVDWQFFISRIKADNLTKLQTFDQISADNDVVFNEVNLNEKDYFYLSGGEFLYRIRIEKLSQNTGDMPCVLIKSVGELPTTEPTTNQPNDEHHKALQFEALLLSALAVIVSEEKEPVRFGELVEEGVADELIKRGWIRPCVSLSHRVRLTSVGESVLKEVLERAGVL